MRIAEVFGFGLLLWELCSRTGQVHTKRSAFLGREGHGGKSCADGIFINFLFFANLVEKAAVFS